MASAFELLRLRQSKNRSEFASRDKCDCKQATPATYNGGRATIATVRQGTSIVPVKVQSNGWIGPSKQLPIVVSGGVRYVFSMPQGKHR